MNGIDVWDDESASDYTIVRCSNEAYRPRRLKDVTCGSLYVVVCLDQEPQEGSIPSASLARLVFRPVGQICALKHLNAGCRTEFRCRF